MSPSCADLLLLLPSLLWSICGSLFTLECPIHGNLCWLTLSKVQDETSQLNVLVSHLSLRPLDSAFHSLSSLDIPAILWRKLRLHIFRRLVILVVTFHVSKTYKATQGKLQVSSWSVTFRPTTLDAQTVWSFLKLNRLRWFFFSRLF